MTSMIPAANKDTVAVVAELEQIAKDHGGELRATDVVAFARDESTALHKKFDWNDGTAAEKWRLEQARHIIRVTITLIDEKLPPVRAYVSITEDRAVGGGAYRRITDILSDEELTKRMMRDALSELEALRHKYQALGALPAWKKIDKSIAAFTNPGKKRGK